MNKDFESVNGYVEKKENEDKYKYIVSSKKNGIIKESDYIYNSNQEAEKELGKAFPDLTIKNLMSE